MSLKVYKCTHKNDARFRVSSFLDFNVQRKLNTNINVEAVGGRGREGRRERESQQRLKER